MHEHPIHLDAAVLQGLYAAHARPLAAYACTLTNSPEEAEDLVHEAFASILGTSATARMPLAYLIRAVRNKAMDQSRTNAARCRAERSARETAEEVSPGQHNPELAAQSAAACAALAALSTAAAEVVTLRARCGLSFPEIALICDEPVGTVSARYARAIATVRAALHAGVAHD